MYKVAVIGDKDSVYVFTALGLTVFYAESAAEASETLRRLIAEDKFAVIYITEYLASMIVSETEKYSSQKIPAIIQIPALNGNTNMGIEDLNKLIKRAVGADINNG